MAEWMAYHDMSPWDEERADLRAGIVASTIVNVNGGKSKPSDFLPKYGQEEPKPQQTPEQIRTAALRINAFIGGTVR